MREPAHRPTLKLSAALRELRMALDAVDLSHNALALTEMDADGPSDDATATIAYPSAFTTDVAFVGVLAYFVQAALPMRLELAQYTADGDDLLQLCCLYPGLDDASLEPLRAINPRRAQDQANAQRQAASALARLQAAAEHQGFTLADDATPAPGGGSR